ncbi:MAG: hypothetical protein ACD_46C00080G0010 [uncultured bacterium]|nr:MAG: hypothetical protein ACD_46C00080G0010 [uncultured bacterium]
MFRQEVNLYQTFEDPIAPITPITWKQMWIINTIFLFSLIIITFSNYWHINTLKKTKIELLKKVQETQAAFYKIKSTYPSVFFSRDVAQSIEKMEREILAREKLLQKTANHGLFSQQLEAFSTAIVPNVWLTEITLSKSGDHIIIKGQSQSAAEMQQFIMHLTSEKIFSTYALSVKTIEDNTKTEAKGDLLFELNLIRNSI